MKLATRNVLPEQPLLMWCTRSQALTVHQTVAMIQISTNCSLRSGQAVAIRLSCLYNLTKGEQTRTRSLSYRQGSAAKFQDVCAAETCFEPCYTGRKLQHLDGHAIGKEHMIDHSYKSPAATCCNSKGSAILDISADAMVAAGDLPACTASRCSHN